MNVAAEELPRPGVEVIQEFRTTTPSTITPTLVPCIVGVAKQIVDVLVSDGAGGSQLNPDALILLPALIISNPGSGNPLRYTGIGTAPNNQLVLSVDESPEFTLYFSDPTGSGLTPATVVSQINTQLATEGISSVVAELVGTDTWQLRTAGKGEFSTIYVGTGTSAAVATTLGIGVGKTYQGSATYQQYEVDIPPTALPDPRNNLDELGVDLDSIRAFLFTGYGAGLQECLRDKSFLRKGSVAGAVVTTPGAVNLSSAFPFFDDEVLWVIIDGGETQVITIPVTVTSSTQLLAFLNGPSGVVGATASLGAGNGLIFTHTIGGYAHTIELATPDLNSAMGLLGLTAEVAYGTSIQSVDDGNGDAVTPLVQLTGATLTTSPAAAVLTGTGNPDFTGLSAGMTLVLSDGQQPQTVIFDGTETTIANLKTAIEAIVGAAAGGSIVASDSSGKLRLTNTKLGEESQVSIIGGTALPYLDTGNTPAVTLEGTVSLSADTAAASYEGTADLADVQPVTVAALTFSLGVDGGVATTVNLGLAGSDHTSVATFLAFLNGQLTGAVASQGARGGVIFTSSTSGSTSEIVLAEVAGGLAALGVTAGIYSGADVFPTLGTQSMQVSIDGAAAITYTLASQTSFATVKSALESALSGLTATQGPDGGLVLTGTSTGSLGTIELIDNGGGALQLLGLTEGVYAGNGEALVAGAIATGTPFVPLPGDELWIDGIYYATISKVAPGSLVNTVRIDRQVPISSNLGTYWYIIAKNLSVGSTTGVTRPTPDLVVGLDRTVTLKHSQLRDIRGDLITGKAPVYLSYKAVRKDVSAIASQPGLLSFNNTIEVEDQLGDATPDNPLALGLFYALLNAPGIQVTGLGVDEVSDDSPYGTVEAFTRAAEYLEGFEVYAIAPLTHDSTVGQVFSTHVTYMSEPTSKGERISLWNPSTPTRALHTLVASSTDGDGLTTYTFDTKVLNLSTLLANAGVNPVGTMPVSSGVFLDLASDGKQYSVASISGGVVTIRTVFAAGENEDGFYATTPLPLPLIGEVFAVRVRGSELVTSTGQMDKAAVANAVAGLGRSFSNRRFWVTFPDQAAATVSGLEQTIEGFYLNAASAGMIGQTPPQQSATNYPLVGFTQVKGSNDTFSDRQLNVMAAGGTYIYVQDAVGGPITSRMALTSDMTSIETRTDSITKAVDFTAKFMRKGVKNFVGRFNISQGFLDTLGTVLQGLGSFLVESKVMNGVFLNNIIQDENARDTVLADFTLDPPYPCNYIRLTLVV